MNRQSSRTFLVPLLILIALIVIAVSIGSQTSLAQGPLSVVFAPVQGVLSNVGRALSNAFNAQGDVVDLARQNRDLQNQVSVLTVENARLRGYQAEIKQYRDLLNFATNNPTLSVIGADVIGLSKAECRNPQAGSNVYCADVIASDTNPFLRYVTINAGKNTGVRVGMPVVSGGLGLVGRIGQVSESSAQVQLIDDPGSSINVILKDARTNAVVVGDRNVGLKLQGVVQTDVISSTDLVLTSGLGRGLPPGIPVGSIDKIISTDAQLFKEASIVPAVDLNHLQTVLIISYTAPSTLQP